VTEETDYLLALRDWRFGLLYLVTEPKSDRVICSRRRAQMHL